MKVYCYCNGISEGMLELRLCMYVCMCIHMYIVLKMHLRGHHVCVFIACGLKIIAADVEHGAIASQTWGSSDALSNEDMRMVLNWESLDTLCLNALGLN